MTYRVLGRAGLAVLAMVGAAAPAPAAQRLYVPAGKWTLDFAETRCTLARRSGGPASSILMLSSSLGRDEPELVLVRDGAEELPDLPGEVRVILSTGGEGEEVTVVRSQSTRSPAILLSGLKEGFFDRFAASQSLRIAWAGKDYLTVSTPLAARAVSTLRSCNDDLLRSWGIDTALSDKLTPARQSAGSISDTDYPGEAVRAGQQGVVVTRFTIGVNGRPTDCAVVVSSKVDSLDETSCRLVTSRFRFDPARGPDGQAVETKVIRTIAWRLPG